MSVSCLEEAEQAARQLLARGVGRVVITLGGEGALTVSQNQPEPRHVPVVKVQPVDTTVCIHKTLDTILIKSCPKKVQSL